MKTLYISDLDGTLLNSGAQVSQATQRVVGGFIKRGGLFTVATGRSYTTSSQVVRCLNLNLPLVTYNGAFLVKPWNGAAMDFNSIARMQAAGLIGTIRAAGMFPVVFSLVGGADKASWIEGRENDGLRGFLAARRGDPRLRPVKDDRQLSEGSVFAVTVIGGREQMAELEAALGAAAFIQYSISEDTYTPGEYWMDITGAGASKANAVKRLREFTGADEVVVFGDNMNDIPMFQAADRSYAVANACEELREIATGVIGGNDEDAVAGWLEENAEGAKLASIT